MTRGYFDVTDPGIEGYSMARYLAGVHGLAVLTIDHVGVGESDQPRDGYELTPAVIADVNDHVVRTVLGQLRAGQRPDGSGEPVELVPIGLGHSMGGLLAVHQQARHRTFAALALLGFAGGGLRSALTDEELRYEGDPDGLAMALPALVAARFGRPLPLGGTASSDFLIAGVSEPLARQALARTQGALLALAGLTSMVPGSTAPALASIDVPVFFGVGEHDITGDARVLPGEVPASSDVTLFVLAGSGHNHNIADNRQQLWDRVARWIDYVTG
jgi:pimeloyl-ACP methyl ester carboxylesterase